MSLIRYFAALAVVLLIGAATYAFWTNKYAPRQKACTLEAKLCPDGSAVGRTGPNCEFAPCPSASGEPNFTKTGVLMYGNPGFAPETLFLSYEEPGKPGLSVRLIFTADSACEDTNRPRACAQIYSDPDVLRGTRAQVEGILAGDAVIVRRLDIEP